MPDVPIREMLKLIIESNLIWEISKDKEGEAVRREHKRKLYYCLHSHKEFVIFRDICWYITCEKRSSNCTEWIPSSNIAKIAFDSPLVVKFYKTFLYE